MLGKFFEKEAPVKGNYLKAIKMESEYEDGKKFPLDEIVEAKQKVNLNAIEKDDMGGFNVANNESILRWLLRGDTICDVIIPDGEKIYEAVNKSTNGGTYRTNKIILTNPQKITDKLALEYYYQSNLPWKSYIQVLAYISTQGFKETSYKIFEDKINKENATEALDIFDNYLERRSDPMPEVYIEILNKIKSLL